MVEVFIKIGKYVEFDDLVEEVIFSRKFVVYFNLEFKFQFEGKVIRVYEIVFGELQIEEGR